ncbi:MAG: DNA polymerase IV, partial [Christensenellaceae bacterium]|nr:DNA polymerase IV [Christensenellaceae bacterium]
MERERIILHCDCNSFFASVEQVLNPALANLPMAVTGDPTKRHGIILAKNELAKAAGVQTAETIWQAKQKCPELICVPSHHDKYGEYSAKCNEIYDRFTDQVEPFGIDESWLDVTGSVKLFGSGETIANKIRETVKAELGITISVGVSFNKIFAKLGSDYKKPDAVTVITRNNFKDILHPLPVRALTGVGRKTLPELHRLNIKTIGDLANADRTILITTFGKMGGVLHDYANGLDNSPVTATRPPEKSVGNGATFEKDLSTFNELLPRIIELAESVGFRCRKAGVRAGVLAITIKDPNFNTIVRQKILA